jgi:Coenzyme PQQ synthesis protein D (PqqD)
MTLEPYAILVRDDEPRSAMIDGRTVALSVRVGAYFDFNQVGSEIWSMLEQPRTVVEIVDRLSGAYGVDADTIRHDVSAFLQALIERGLLRVVSVTQGR